MPAVKKQWIKVRGGDEPSESIDPVDEDEDGRSLAGAEATLFRGIAARLNALHKSTKQTNNNETFVRMSLSEPLISFG